MTKLILTTLLMFCSIAYGIQPENGTWWNPNASGSGYNIEIQDNTLVLTAYSYEANGLPTFYLSAGKMSSDRNYSGILNKYVNGQCLNCNYKSPSSIPAGTVNINFTHGTMGNISFNGGTPINIQRFGFAVDNTTYAFLYGDWAITEGTLNSGGVFSGTRMVFSAPYTSTTDGVTAAVGNISGTNNIVVGLKDNTNYSNAFNVLQDYSSTHYKFYTIYTTGINSITGTSYIYPKSSTLSGSGTAFVGFRARGYSAVNNINAPGQSVFESTTETETNINLLNELIRITKQIQENNN